jgi:RhtB (resistance to homoserine/threonine) family protein
MQSELIPFLGAAVLIAATPGPDTAVVVRSALRTGSRDALLAAAGTCSGLIVWGALAALGVAALLAASAALFTAVKLAGAAYLLWLGVQAIRGAGSAPPVEPAARPARGAFTAGLLTNLLNPKAALFFTALLPQFIAPQDPALAVSALMTAIASLASFAWLAVYALLVPRGGDVLRRPVVRRRIDRCTGAVLVLLGLRVALERR